ncbi:unnamed protein product [Ectocarpus sp. 4 AP-2014]
MAHPSAGAAEAVHDVGLDLSPTAATPQQQLQQQQQSHATTTAAAVASDGPSLAASSSVGAAAAPVSTAVAAAVTLQQEQQQPPPSLPPPRAALPPVPIDVSNNNGSAGAAAPASSTSPAGDPQQLYSPSGRKRKQRTSGVWKYFEQFPPVAPKGRNVRCTVLLDVPADPALGLPQRTVRCGATYTHVESRPGNGGSGTSGMLHHLFKKHPLIHAEIIRANSSSKMRKAEGAVVKQSAASSSGSGGGSKEPPQPHHPSSLGSALAQLRACSLAGGGGSALPSPPMSAEDCLPHDRRFVLMCALQTLDPDSLCSNLGHRLFVGGLAPGYGAGRRLASLCNGLAPSGSSYAASTAVTEGANGAGAGAGGTANGILQDLCAGVRREVTSALRAHSASCRQLGWCGPFVGLQVDSTGVPGGEGGSGGGGGEEVCTASVSFVSEDFGDLVRLAIGARCFRGRQTSHAKEAWIRELTADLFTSICHKSEPKDIYLAATVGGCSGGGGSSFGRPFQDMGVPVLVCSSYRLHSAVSCSLGCAAAEGGSEDSCANAKMRDVVRRAVSMVEVFEHWRPEGGVFAAATAAAVGSGSGPATTLETVRVEVEELAAALARVRGSNTRRVAARCAGVSAVRVWTDSHALFERLLQLAGPLNAHFRQTPTDRSLQPSEWQAIREAASILEPALEVLAKVHARDEGEMEGEMEGEEGRRAAERVGTSAAAAAGAAARDKKKPRGVFLAESIELHANLHCSFIYPLQDIRGDALATAAKGEGVAAAPAMVAAAAAAVPFCSKRVAELTPEAQALLEAVAQGMEESGLGRAREDTEAVSMLLDPRFKQCCASTCVDGGSALKLRALKAVSSQLRKFRDPASEAGGGQGGAGHGGGGAAAARQEPGAAAAAGGGGARPVSRLDKMRQAQKMEAAAAGAAAAAGGAGGPAPPPGENGAGGAGGGGGGGGAPGEVDNRLSEDARAELEEYLLEPASKRHELLSYWRLHGTDTLDSGTGEVVLAARWPHLALVARLYAGIDSTSRQGERHFGGGSGGGAELGAAVRSLQRGGMPPWRIEQMLLVRLNRHLVPEVVDFVRGGC